jgi:hypothetical protein
VDIAYGGGSRESARAYLDARNYVANTGLCQTSFAKMRLFWPGTEESRLKTTLPPRFLFPVMTRAQFMVNQTKPNHEISVPWFAGEQ